MDLEEIERHVKNKYEHYAEEGESAFVCPIRSESEHLGLKRYTEEELNLLPPLAKKLSTGCGAPVSFADIKEGETGLCASFKA